MVLRDQWLTSAPSLSTMMAISSSEILKAADRVWGMLDHLAEHNPQEYHKFVDKQLSEGREMFAVPQPAFCLCCNTYDVSISQLGQD